MEVTSPSPPFLSCSSHACLARPCLLENSSCDRVASHENTGEVSVGLCYKSRRPTSWLVIAWTVTLHATYFGKLFFVFAHHCVRKHFLFWVLHPPAVYGEHAWHDHHRSCMISATGNTSLRAFTEEESASCLWMAICIPSSLNSCIESNTCSKTFWCSHLEFILDDSISAKMPVQQSPIQIIANTECGIFTMPTMCLPRSISRHMSTNPAHFAHFFHVLLCKLTHFVELALHNGYMCSIVDRNVLILTALMPKACCGVLQ